LTLLPDLAPWQWALGVFCAFLLGVGKTGAPGAGTLTAPLMVLAVGDARLSPAWTAPILIVGDVFAVSYWRRHAEARSLFSLIPWVALGMAAGAFALSLSELVLRRMVGVIVLSMLAVNIARRWYPEMRVSGHAPVYGVAAGFATTVATSAGPVMSLYLLTKRLPKERFVATGAWFFLVVNVAKLPIYAAHRLFSPASLVFDAIMVPPVLCGAMAGLWLVRRIPQRTFEILIITLTALSSIFLFR
jgi:uncharacterized membrane protein YfcA